MEGKTENQLPPDWWDDDEEINLDDTCPYCSEDYDEIDYEYQMCHHCGFNNTKPN